MTKQNKQRKRVARPHPLYPVLQRITAARTIDNLVKEYGKQLSIETKLFARAAILEIYTNIEDTHDDLRDKEIERLKAIIKELKANQP